MLNFSECNAVFVGLSKLIRIYSRVTLIVVNDAIWIINLLKKFVITIFISYLNCTKYVIKFVTMLLKVFLPFIVNMQILIMIKVWVFIELFNFPQQFCNYFHFFFSILNKKHIIVFFYVAVLQTYIYFKMSKALSMWWRCVF